eukprot:4453231-Ditylum_brightwellii.AAC.1
MEPEVAGSRLDITIGVELTALKRATEKFSILQYHIRSMRIMASQEENFAGPFMKALARP